MKLNIRKKLVSLAVASAVTGGAMMAIPAQAMNVSQNSVGQVLLFPYFTTNNGFDTILSVVNTSDKTALFKIRFREPVDSKEVRDFNVILSPRDVWNGAVTVLEDGSTGFRTYDKSCTSPMLPGMETTAARASGQPGQIHFDATQGDITQGYFEIILMGVADSANAGTEVTTLRVSSLHGSDGVPANCAAADALFISPATVTTLDGQMSAPENILKGTVTYLNVTHGTSFNVSPTAIENFQTTEAIVFPPENASPDLNNGDILSTINYLDNGQPLAVGPFAESVDAVSALLTYGSIANEFASGTNAFTSWVVTLPTKHHYGSHLDCYEVALSKVNREEGGALLPPGSTHFSPYNPADPKPDSLCNESTVFNFNGSQIFGSVVNNKEVSTKKEAEANDVGPNGWVTMAFVDGIDNGSSIAGLPVIGFSAKVLDSADATVNYGSAYEFAGKRSSVAP